MLQRGEKLPGERLEEDEKLCLSDERTRDSQLVLDESWRVESLICQFEVLPKQMENASDAQSDEREAGSGKW